MCYQGPVSDMFFSCHSGAFNHKTRLGSAIPPHPSAATFHDPNDETSQDAVMYWLGYADFYTWPHILVWDSIPELIHICVPPLPPYQCLAVENVAHGDDFGLRFY